MSTSSQLLSTTAHSRECEQSLLILNRGDSDAFISDLLPPLWSEVYEREDTVLHSLQADAPGTQDMALLLGTSLRLPARFWYSCYGNCPQGRSSTDSRVGKRWCVVHNTNANSLKESKCAILFAKYNSSSLNLQWSLKPLCSCFTKSSPSARETRRDHRQEAKAWSLTYIYYSP